MSIVRDPAHLPFDGHLGTMQDTERRLHYPRGPPYDGAPCLHYASEAVRGMNRFCANLLCRSSV